MQYDCSVSQVSSLSSCDVPSASPHTRSAEIKASALRPAALGCCDHGNALAYGISLSSGGLGGVWGFRESAGWNAPPLRALRLLALNERGVSVSMGNASPGTRAAFAITNRLNTQMLEETESCRLCRASGTLPLLYRNKCC